MRVVGWHALNDGLGLMMADFFVGSSATSKEEKKLIRKLGMFV